MDVVGRRTAGVGVRLLVAAWGCWVAACSADDVRALVPVSQCTNDEACMAADDRYDVCQWVCEGHVTYCQVSCENDGDCRGRGLPDDYVFCDIPRPGEGFCNPYGYGYPDGACDQEVPEIPDAP